ncbi:Threonine aldolase [Coemansia sp. RSA 1694]|nr:Threonine aldolase [Coemansia sp. RSA 1694]
MPQTWDLRSDTATTPTSSMLSAMINARVGDDVLGEDPTVNELEQTVARLCGHESALFCVSSTMANQLAIRTHLSNPPESMLCHWDSHVFKYESGGTSLHSQALMIPIHPTQGRVNLTVEDIKKHFVRGNFLGHCAPTHLVALENTLSGVIMPIDDIKEISQFVREDTGSGAAALVHMDGSRLWNAAMSKGHGGAELQEYARHVDSLSLCLSKGMGCPVGALLVGSRRFIEKARHFRKAFGGGWRQAGILAAAGLYAIEHVWPTMPATHERARRLARGLESVGFVLALPVHTNMVLLDSTKEVGVSATELAQTLKPKGIILGAVYEGTMLRIVLHHQIDDECVETILATARELSSDRH